MNRFDYARPKTVAEALQAGAGEQVRYLAGGTNLIDLMKQNVERPVTVVDINRLPLNTIVDLDSGGLRLGALVPNSDTAWDKRVEQRYPLLSSAILAGASPNGRVTQHRVTHLKLAREAVSLPARVKLAPRPRSRPGGMLCGALRSCVPAQRLPASNGGRARRSRS